MEELGYNPMAEKLREAMQNRSRQRQRPRQWGPQIDPNRPLHPFFVYSSELDPEHGIDKSYLKNFMDNNRDSKTDGDFTDNVLIQHFRNLGWKEQKHTIYKFDKIRNPDFIYDKLPKHNLPEMNEFNINWNQMFERYDKYIPKLYQSPPSYSELPIFHKNNKTDQDGLFETEKKQYFGYYMDIFPENRNALDDRILGLKKCSQDYSSQNPEKSQFYYDQYIKEERAKEKDISERCALYETFFGSKLGPKDEDKQNSNSNNLTKYNPPNGKQLILGHVNQTKDFKEDNRYFSSSSDMVDDFEDICHELVEWNPQMNNFFTGCFSHINADFPIRYYNSDIVDNSTELRNEIKINQKNLKYSYRNFNGIWDNDDFIFIGMMCFPFKGNNRDKIYPLYLTNFLFVRKDTKPKYGEKLLKDTIHWNKSHILTLSFYHNFGKWRYDLQQVSNGFLFSRHLITWKELDFLHRYRNMNFWVDPEYIHNIFITKIKDDKYIEKNYPKLQKLTQKVVFNEQDCIWYNIFKLENNIILAVESAVEDYFPDGIHRDRDRNLYKHKQTCIESSSVSGGNYTLDKFFNDKIETHTDKNLRSHLYKKTNKLMMKSHGTNRINSIKDISSTFKSPTHLVIQKYFNNYLFLNPIFFSNYTLNQISPNFDILKEKYNPIYSNEVKSICKYIPQSFRNTFFIYIEVLFKFKSILKTTNTFLEITRSPGAFEAIEYLSRKCKYNIKNIDVITTTDRNNDHIKRAVSKTSFKALDNLLNVNLNNHSYSFLIVKIYKYSYIPTEFHYRSKWMPYQLLYIQKYLEKNGSCVFEIPCILSTYYASIVQILKSWFKKIEIYSPETSFGTLKSVPGKWILCYQRKDKLNHISSIKKFISNIEKLKLFDSEYIPIEKTINLHEPIINIKPDLDLYKEIQLDNLRHDREYIYVITKAINMMNEFPKMSKKNKDKSLKAARIKQYIHSYNWAKKYDFEIYEPYEKFAYELLFGRSRKDYDDIYLEDIVLNINDFKNVLGKNIDIHKNIDDAKSRYSEIHSIIDTRPLKEWNKLKKYRYYRSTKKELTLNNYIREKFGIYTASQAWQKMFTILDIVPEIIEQYKTRKDSNFTSFHLCEAPGAFISALHYYLLWNHKRIHKKWNWTAQSLMDDTDDKFGDNFGFIRKYRDNWDFGPLGTGDILSLKNQRYYLKKYGRKEDDTGGVDFVTLDCGSSEMGSESMQKGTNLEDLTLFKLRHAEQYLILNLVKVGGCGLFKSSLPLPKIEELKHLLKFENAFEKVYYIKPRLNLQSGEYYIVGVNKLPSNKSRNIDINDYLDRFLQIQNVLLENHDLDIRRRVFYLDNIDKLTEHHMSKLENLVRNENVDWCEEMGLEKMHKRKSEIF